MFERWKEVQLENRVTLSGSFCAGKCNRIGVTVFVNDEVIIGVTPENVMKLWDEKVVPLLK